MAKKFMGVGGRNVEGKAKPLILDDDGNLLTHINGFQERMLRQNLTVTPKGFERIHIETKNPYVITVIIQNSKELAWRLRQRPELLDEFLLDQAAREVILQSNGKVVAIGTGSRASAQSHIINPKGSKTEFLFENMSDNDLIADIYISEYSYGVQSDKCKNTEKPIYINSGSTLEIDKNDEKIIFDTDKYFELDHFEFATNMKRGRVLFSYRDSEGDIQVLGAVSGTNINSVGFRPNELLDSSICEINRYADSEYKFSLKKKWKFPLGLKIILRSDSENITKFSARGYGMERYD